MLRFAITQGTLTGNGHANKPAALVRQVIGPSVDFLLVREKQLDANALTTLCRQIKAVTSAQVLVSGRPDIALAAGLDGVHLSSRTGELTVHQARSLGMHWVSVSCHTQVEVEAAKTAGANAVLFGPVFGKTIDGVEVVEPLGLEALRAACAAGIPVFALGGVTEANASACADAGAKGIAAIRMFFAPNYQLSSSS